MEIKKIALNLFDRVKISLWFVVLLFPLTVMKVSVTGGAATVKFRWVMVPVVGVAAFVLSWIWTRALVWNERRGQKPDDSSISYRVKKIVSPLWEKKTVRFSGLAAVMLFVVLYPHLFGMYHTNIMITALLYVILALGLNIHVG